MDGLLIRSFKGQLTSPKLLTTSCLLKRIHFHESRNVHTVSEFDSP